MLTRWRQRALGWVSYWLWCWASGSWRVAQVDGYQGYTLRWTVPARGHVFVKDVFVGTYHEALAWAQCQNGLLRFTRGREGHPVTEAPIVVARLRFFTDGLCATPCTASSGLVVKDDSHAAQKEQCFDEKQVASRSSPAVRHRAHLHRRLLRWDARVPHW